MTPHVLLARTNSLNIPKIYQVVAPTMNGLDRPDLRCEIAGDGKKGIWLQGKVTAERVFTQ
jgi:hypothetical protein